MPKRIARVLVVDSEPKVLHTVSSLLRQEGHQVDTAETLAAALKTHATNAPDVLLTELTVGEMDLLAEARRAVWPATVCVLLTGYATIEIGRRRCHAPRCLRLPRQTVRVVEDLKQTIVRSRWSIVRRPCWSPNMRRRLRRLNDDLEECRAAAPAPPELAAANDRLAEANAAKDRFLATLSCMSRARR